jgi:hypothetical protein
VAPTSCGQSYRTQSQDLFRMCSSSKCISGYDWHWCAQCLSVVVHGNDYWDYREGCALPACARRPSANSDTDQTAGVVPCAAATCRPRLFSAPPTSRHRRHSQRHQASLAMPRTPAPAPPAGRERRPLRTPSAGGRWELGGWGRPKEAPPPLPRPGLGVPVAALPDVPAAESQTGDALIVVDGGRVGSVRRRIFDDESRQQQLAYF